MNREVTLYIERQISPQKEICQRLREIILRSFPAIGEEMKMGVPWYEGKFYLVALKDHVNLGVSIKGLSPPEINAFSGKGKTMRHIQISSVSEIDEAWIVPLLKLVYEKSVL
jgi:hypothetical protein